ncbi:MAG: SDR family oxidoreductase [Pseudonocardia sp.]|nr:SDR family oxidoreductase [Pseudonocardia sp.]
MRVLVIGGTGYVGARLVPRLLADGRTVRCLVRDPAKLARESWAGRVEATVGDVADPAVGAEACRDVDAVVYLVHSMDGPDFAERDALAATALATAARDADVQRIVYLGGLQPSGGNGTSEHLGSRDEVGRILLGSGVPTAVLRAGIVVGRGSASFEMIRHLTETVMGGLPVLTVPDQAWNRVQPVAIDDVVHWLAGALTLPAEVSRAFDVGGPDVVRYLDLMNDYAREAGLARAFVVPLPVSAPRLAARVVGRLTPVDRRLAAPLLESMAHELVMRDDDLAGLVGEPPGGRTSYRAAVRRALAEDGPAGGSPNDPTGSGPAVLVTEDVEEVAAPADVLWSVIAGLGGDEGWYTVPGVWRLRALLDGLLGGPGVRRSRPATLVAGAALDWWRVEEVDPGRSILLRAEMRLPGTARLEMRAEPAGEGRSRYVQRVTFAPRGLAGRLYWFAQRPAHDLVFGVMARTVAGVAGGRRRRPRLTTPRTSSTGGG